MRKAVVFPYKLRRSVGGALLVSACLGGAGALRAQTTHRLDRWLVTSQDSGREAGAGLATRFLDSDAPVFPERAREAGPGYWTLVRDDGAERVSLQTDPAVSSGPVLAHAYIRVRRDRTARLELTASCGAVDSWLNGQRILGREGAREAYGRQVRLAGGWNTLLVRIDPEPTCRPALGGSVALVPPLEGEAGSEGVDSVRVQASRPPGIRRTHPHGWMTLDGVTLTGPLEWEADSDQLVGTLEVELSSWGRDSGTPASEEEETDDEPPAVNVSGRWNFTLTSPLGLQRSVGDLEMDEDGTISGELKRPEGGEGDDRNVFGGSIRDGRVSGDRVRFLIRFSAPRGRSSEVEFDGVVADDRMEGTVGFGRVGDFESRFEAVRADADGEAGGSTDGDASPAPPSPGRPAPDAHAGDVPGLFPGGGRNRASDLRQRIRSRLLPPAVAGPPGPRAAALDVRVGGARVQRTIEGLTAGKRARVIAPVAFERLRRAALQGVEAEAAWSDPGGDDHEIRTELSLAPTRVLEAFHGPIRLSGWSESGSERSGEWRVPDVLDGFSLVVAQAADGIWSRDGAALTEVNGRGALCSPCRKGERLLLSVTRISRASFAPEVQVLERGYFAGSAVGAREWLQALGDDNRRYRNLSASPE